MKKRYSDEQNIRILRKAEISDQTISELCRQKGLRAIVLPLETDLVV